MVLAPANAGTAARTCCKSCPTVAVVATTTANGAIRSAGCAEIYGRMCTCVCVSDCRGWMRGASGRAATVPLLTNENLTAVVPGSPCLASGSNAGGQPA